MDCESGGKLKDFLLCAVEVHVNPKDDVRLFGGVIHRHTTSGTRRGEYRMRRRCSRPHQAVKQSWPVPKNLFSAESRRRLRVFHTRGRENTTWGQFARFPNDIL